MSYTELDAQQDAYYDNLQRLFQEDLKSQARDAVKSYLGRYGDAVDQRVLASLSEARALLKAQHFGPALCTAVIALELMIRFMLVRPLIQGAFLSDEWADILTTRIATGQTARDRELVAAVLRQWGLDVTKVRGSVSNTPVWEFIVNRLFPTRHNYVHRYDPVPEDVAAVGVDCAETFRYEIVGSVAKQMGFTLEATGKWREICHPKKTQFGIVAQSEWIEKFPPADPFVTVERGHT